MNTLQRLFNFTALTCFLTIGAVVVGLAQTNMTSGDSVTGPLPFSVSDSPLPASQSEFWTFAIAIVVPLIVGGLKKLFPVIPKWALPISTPFVGMALGAALKALGAADMSWVDMGQAGAMAVMIRESWNKIVTEPIKGEEGAKTKDTEDVEREERKR